jgi:tRNA U34 5-methylaminomethyl-2-thiouridine-forming methyltransferase MnmC
MKRRIIETADGSSSIFVEELDEYYHSIHGARNESEHVFIQYGLAQIKGKNSIKLLEVGFGTALNALLSCLYAIRNEICIEYHAIEAFPLQKNEIKALQFANNEEESAIFNRIHQADWNKRQIITDQFIIFKEDKKIQQLNLPLSYYDVIFYDAFSPKTQPEMWTAKNLEKITAAMQKNAVFTTYCVKGDIKRTLKNQGLEIIKQIGPKGKREILNAIKR